MKVAYLINQYPQPSQSFIRREIAALEALGVAVERFTVRRWDGPLVDPADEEERRRTRVVLDVGALGLIARALLTMFTYPSLFIKAARLAVSLGRRSDRGVIVHAIYLVEACVLRAWFRKGGVRHVHAHFGTNSATVALLCSALGGPAYSFTTHGPEEFDKPSALALGEKVQRSAFAVAISDYGCSQLYRWTPQHAWSKVHVVRCGLDAPFFAGPNDSPPATRRLVCVGRLVEQKGQLILIEAAARLHAVRQDFEIVLVGDGPMRNAIETRIAELGLHAAVRLDGWQSNAYVRTLLLESRAMVLPSFAEGLPVALMEALALGRPVVSTYVAAIPELVLPGENGWLVAPGSVDALAQAMAEVLDAPEETLARMGRAGAARVLALHRAASKAEQLAHLFHESMGAVAVPTNLRNDLAFVSPSPRGGSAHAMLSQLSAPD